MSGKRGHLAATVVAAFTWVISAAAQAAYIPLDIPARADYAFDRNGVLYVTAGPQVVRYDTRTGTYLSPFQVGGSLVGIDLSPDGRTLAVADSGTQGSNNRVVLVDTGTGAVQSYSSARQSLETGTYMVAWGADGRVLSTSYFAGSGWVPLRRLNPATGVTEEIGSVRQNSMLTPSADRRTIGIVESNISSGPVHAYDVAAGAIGASTGTDWFNFEVAVSPNGSRFLVPTYGGALAYDRSGSQFTRAGQIGEYASWGPLSAVFSPNGRVIFTSDYDWSNRVGGVKVYDANTLQQIAVLDPVRFGWQGNFAMGEGRLEVSPDGRWLAASVANGVRLYDVSAYVPEPSSAAVLACGATGMVLLRRRRRA